MVKNFKSFVGNDKKGDWIGLHEAVANFSGNANNGGSAGAFYWNLNNVSSNLNRNIGARMVVYKNSDNLPLPLEEYLVHESLVNY